MTTSMNQSFDKESPRKIYHDARRFTSSTTIHKLAIGNKFDDTPLPQSVTK